ncbi:trigger factor [Oribacterium parvum ACB1]|jgi:trigger factor|uniref:Trigger factor n=1 Tax=Oribacterium parvum ACB1 TaxID=796943 RepID=G9WLW1_9FIRM|nr:trigger factor [Oribacterium parvum]EHL12766.1 trigger factor [Oribacterium parvum ACB1]EJF12471.1 trigger factor [Oribacterium parvum ACB8]
MSVKVENLEKSMAKLTVTVAAEEFEKAVESAYQRTKSRYNVPGFRKGKATRKMIEKAYGAQVFYDAALNEVLDRHYPEAAAESGLDIVSRPEIEIKELEEGKDLVFTASVAVRPEVKLGEYFGVEAEKADVSVSAKEVTERLNRELEKNSRMIDVDRAIKKNDIATIDFVGSVNGKEFAGGRGEDYPLTIGSGTFIPGFEDQLIGAKAGDNVDVKVTFPENYGAKDLAGKEALFKVTVKLVKEKQVPKADDEFASEVSEFDTLDEYKKDIKKQIKEEKEKRAGSEVESHVIAKVVENAEVELPEPMVATQLDQMFYDYARRMEQQGIPMEQYMQITGLTEQALKEQMRASAVQNIKTSLVLDAIQKKEGIEASDEKLEEELQRISDQYRMKKEDFVKTITDSQKASIKRELSIQATIDALVEKAKLVKAEKKTKKEEKAEKEEA